MSTCRPAKLRLRVGEDVNGQRDDRSVSNVGRSETGWTTSNDLAASLPALSESCEVPDVIQAAEILDRSDCSGATLNALEARRSISTNSAF